MRPGAACKAQECWGCVQRSRVPAQGPASQPPPASHQSQPPGPLTHIQCRIAGGITDHTRGQQAGRRAQERHALQVRGTAKRGV